MEMNTVIRKHGTICIYQSFQTIPIRGPITTRIPLTLRTRTATLAAVMQLLTQTMTMSITQELKEDM